MLSNKNESNTTFCPQPGSHRNESGRRIIATKGPEQEPKAAFTPSTLWLMWRPLLDTVVHFCLRQVLLLSFPRAAGAKSSQGILKFYQAHPMELRF